MAFTKRSKTRSLRNSKTITLVVCALLAALLAFAGGRGFRTQRQLNEHFAKHGKDFGNITQDQYLRMAQELRDSRPGKTVLESKRQGGGGAKFDVKMGYFVAYDADGTIRTFFIPNDGARYFERQSHNHDPVDGKTGR